MAEFTPCRHDGESMVSLMEQHGYSEDDMLLCKLCQKEEIKGLTAALEQAQAVNEAANNLCNWIQRELEQHDGWTQFDFLPVKFDLFWFYQLQKALQSAGDHGNG